MIPTKLFPPRHWQRKLLEDTVVRTGGVTGVERAHPVCGVLCGNFRVHALGVRACGGVVLPRVGVFGLIMGW